MAALPNQKQFPRFSESISGVCQLMEQARHDHALCYETVNRMDMLTQDYLHKLELEDLTYAERAKVATAIKKCRRERRACKDTVEMLEPLIQFLNSEKGKHMMNLLNEVLGQTRRVEKRMVNRTYVPRVLSLSDMKEQQ